jgi:hypothetical protein
MISCVLSTNKMLQDPRFILSLFKLNFNTLTSHLNIQITKTTTEFELSQTHYIQVTLKELKLERLYIYRLLFENRVIKVLLSEHVMRLPMLPLHEITLYQCIIDKLLYTTICTHFDITFSVNMFGRYSHSEFTLHNHNKACFRLS